MHITRFIHLAGRANMTETIYIGGEAGTWFALGFFFAVSVLLGYASYALLARPETRRAEFPSLGAVSRLAASLIAVVLGGTIFLIVCRYMLSGFNRIEVDGEQLRLQYALPARTVMLRRDQMTLLEKRYSTPLAVRLAITMQDGHTYESRPAGANAIEQARLRVALLAAE